MEIQFFSIPVNIVVDIHIGQFILLLSSNPNGVIIQSISNNIIRKFPISDSSEPFGVVFYNSNIYVSYPEENKINIYSINGEFIGSLMLTEFNKPKGLTVDGNLLVICNYGSGDILYYSYDTDSILLSLKLDKCYDIKDFGDSYLHCYTDNRIFYIYKFFIPDGVNLSVNASKILFLFNFYNQNLSDYTTYILNENSLSLTQFSFQFDNSIEFNNNTYYYDTNNVYQDSNSYLECDIETFNVAQYGGGAYYRITELLCDSEQNKLNITARYNNYNIPLNRRQNKYIFPKNVFTGDMYFRLKGFINNFLQNLSIFGKILPKRR